MSLHRNPGSRYWISHFPKPDGGRTSRSTKTTDRDKALVLDVLWNKIARQARNPENRQTLGNRAQEVVDQILEECGEARRRPSVRAYLRECFDLWQDGISKSRKASMNSAFKALIRMLNEVLRKPQKPPGDEPPKNQES